MKEYRVSDVSIDANQPTHSKAALQAKLNALVADGFEVNEILQAGDYWFIVSSKEKK